MRRILFWMHLGAGVLVSAVIVFFSVTGALLAYERQITNAVASRSHPAEAVMQNASRLPLDLLFMHAAKSLPSSVEVLTLHADHDAPIEIETTEHEVYFVDPYSGRMQGPIAPRVRRFFVTVTALHRWFGLSNAHHAAAIAVKGAATLLFLFLLVSGAILWLPKRWSSTAVRTGVLPRFHVQGRARNYSWHKAAGFWFGTPLAIVTVTGVIMAYPWANALLFRVAGSPMPVRNGNGGQRRTRGSDHAIPGHLDQVFAAATSGIRDWRSASLRLMPGTSELNVSVDRSEGGHPEKREQVVMDPTTLQAKRRQPFSALSKGQQWRAWVRFVHTGEAGGLWGETLAFFAACGAVVLSVTGIALSLDRLRRYRERANFPAMLEAEPALKK